MYLRNHDEGMYLQKPTGEFVRWVSNGEVSDISMKEKLQRVESLPPHPSLKKNKMKKILKWILDPITLTLLLTCFAATIFLWDTKTPSETINNIFGNFSGGIFFALIATFFIGGGLGFLFLLDLYHDWYKSKFK